MKRILLSVFTILSLGASAQTIFSENFSGNPFAIGWVSIDANMDNDVWQVMDITGAGTVFDAQAGVAISASTFPGQTNFSPDNILLSPAMDLTLTNSSNSLMMSFKMGTEASTASGNYGEYMSVYLIPSSGNLTDILSSTPIYTGAITAGRVMQVKSANITSFAGQTSMKLAFRHHNCTDLTAVIMDDILVEEVAPTSITLQCGPNQNLTFTANGNQLPNVTTTAQASTTCAGSVTLTQSPAAGTTMTNGANTVTVTATDGCGNTQSCTMTVNFSNNAGLDQLENSGTLIYPNPVSDYLTVLNFSEGKVKVYNMEGKLLIEQTSDAKINVSTLDKGVYFLEIQNSENKFTRTKFVKK